MRREHQVIFFPFVLLDVIAENINKLVSENKEYDMFIEYIGLLKSPIKVKTKSDDEEVQAGRMFIEISENLVNSMFMLQMEFIEGMEEEVSLIQIFDKRQLPPEMFSIKSQNNNKIFIKKVKTRALTSEYIAELDMNIIGVKQNTEHDSVTTTIHMVPLYETEDGYKVTILPSNIEKGYPENVMPPLCIYKEGYLLSINISPKKYKNSCIGCYILDNIEDWKTLIEGINGVVKDRLTDWASKQEDL